MELIKIYKGNVISARELHEFLGVKSHYKDWINNRIKRYQFVEKRDFFKVAKILAGSQKGFDHMLTMTMAKELCMVENNDLGRKARQYFIAAEEKLIQLSQDKRFSAFLKLETTKQKFQNELLERGLNEQDYIEIDTSGKKVFMNGELIPDELLQTVLLTARDLATQMTHYHTIEKDLKETGAIKASNKDNHTGVRNTLLDKGIVPENLPKQESIKKLIDSEE